jgi:hypothetical protein
MEDVVPASRFFFSDTSAGEAQHTVIAGRDVLIEPDHLQVPKILKTQGAKPSGASRG